MAYRNWGGAVIDRAGGDDWTATTAAPSIIPALPHDRSRPPPSRATWPQPKLPRCPEIDCVRNRLPPGVLALAELRSAEAGVGADRVLIAAHDIGEEEYVISLAAALDVVFDPLDDWRRDDCPIPDDLLIEAAITGMLPLAIDDDLKMVIAPRLIDSRSLVMAVRQNPGLAPRLRLTTVARLQNFVSRHGAGEIEHRAIAALQTASPEFSAQNARPRRWVLLALLTAAALLALAAPRPAMAAVELALATIFLAWTGLRLLGLLSERLVRRRPRRFSDDRLPVYSIIVALYRESAAVTDLVAALRGFNYPAEKLDIKLVLEADDIETRQAIAAVNLGTPFEIVIAPQSGPRTKPKALNAALPFARGKFVAVYDAEDRPEPDQLRLALEAFVAGDQRLACVQARLTIDNTADSWLARLFTAEYAGLFDVFLPGLAAWRLPLPLGGSSNHFRTLALRRIGAWDPYNVTEDADLGMRLVRFGLRSAVISSTTYEEAPARLGPWLKQRTRWFKGWMQTWLVHMRTPRRLIRELGLAGFAVFQLLVGGTVLAALVHSLFAAALVWELTFGRTGPLSAVLGPNLYSTTLLAGYLISAALGIIGLARRNLLGCAWVLVLMPVYWLLLSLAAWRALYQLMFDPYRWEKTEHGLARTSRRSGREPVQAPAALRDSASNRWPPLADAA